MQQLYPFRWPSRPFRSPRGGGQANHAGALNVALVIPRSGPAGMFGPSCELSARLATAELNAAAETFVPLGTGDFTRVLGQVERCAADAVLVLLVGDDAARFNRAFAAAGLHERALRLSTLMDETMLLASGPDATVGLWSAAGYFETLATPESLSFGASYARRFGAHAPPVGSPGESCYEGLKFLAALVGSPGPLAGSPGPLAGSPGPLAGSPGPLAGSPGHRRPRRRLPWTAAVDSTPTGLDGYEGARGALRLRGNHVEQPVYLAEADGLDFHVRQRL